MLWVCRTLHKIEHMIHVHVHLHTVMSSLYNYAPICSCLGYLKPEWSKAMYMYQLNTQIITTHYSCQTLMKKVAILKKANNDLPYSCTGSPYP